MPVKCIWSVFRKSHLLSFRLPYTVPNISVLFLLPVVCICYRHLLLLFSFEPRVLVCFRIAVKRQPANRQLITEICFARGSGSRGVWVCGVWHLARTMHCIMRWGRAEGQASASARPSARPSKSSPVWQSNSHKSSPLWQRHSHKNSPTPLRMASMEHSWLPVGCPLPSL